MGHLDDYFNLLIDLIATKQQVCYGHDDQGCRWLKT